jgi:hypothetical protein
MAAGASARRVSSPLLAAALVSLLTALILRVADDQLIAGPYPMVHIRWSAALAGAERSALELQFRIRPAADLGNDTWRYELRDPSRRNVEAIVRHPAIQDTHHLDRRSFVVQADADLSPWTPGPLGMHAPAAAFAVATYGPPLLVALAAVMLTAALSRDRVRDVARRTIGVVMRGVPPLSPRGLALFRAAFGGAIALYLAWDAYTASTPVAREIAVDLTAAAPVRWFAARDGLVNAVRVGAAVAALLFAAGVAPRATYAATAIGTIAWMWAVTVVVGAHPYSVLMLPLLALFAVPWQHAPPLYRLAREAGEARRGFGFAPWVLSLSLSVAMAAAAYAKVREGPEWIAGGNAKFAWVSDARQARVDWGLSLAARPRTAVALSAAAVAVEGLVIVSAFTPHPVIRLLFGAAAGSLLAGFDLLQGVFWPAWWITLLGFVPWDGLVPRLRGVPAAPAGLSGSQVGWAAVVAGQQLIVSAAFIEVHPIASRYDMYSTVHTTADGVGSQRTRRIVALTPDGASVDVTDCAGGVPFVLERLQACTAGHRVTEFQELEDLESFDWTAGRFVWDYRNRLVARVRP